MRRAAQRWWRRAWKAVFMLFCTTVNAESAWVKLDDGPRGASCEYFNLGTRLKWVGKSAEIDPAHVLREPFVFAPETEAVMSLDVAPLVRSAVARGDASINLVLVGESANGALEFYSRESGMALMHPRLKIEWDNGRRDRLDATADTYVACTTRASLGSQERFKVSAGERGLISFPLAKADAAVKSATLDLSIKKIYSSGSFRIGLLRGFDQVQRRETLSGLSAAAGGDRGLQGRPSVVFTESFDDDSWPSHWSYLSKSSSEARIVNRDDALRFEPLGGSALRVIVPKGGTTGLDLRLNFKEVLGYEPNEMYFRYYLRFSDNWHPTVDGGKLPGFAGTYGRAGWGQRRSDGKNGWSARGSFMRKDRGPDVESQPNAIGSYVYHADMTSDYSGDAWTWGDLKSILKNNQWYAVEQYVKLNTPNAADGELRAWVDGVQVFERTGIRFRTTDALHIEQLWMNVYHGGANPTDQDLVLYIDNVVVATEYIGPRPASGASK